MSARGVLDDYGYMVDVAEAALLEPHLNGAAASIDEVLNQMDANIREATAPEDESWIDSEEARQNAAMFEQMMPPSFVPPVVPPPPADVPQPEDSVDG